MPVRIRFGTLRDKAGLATMCRRAVGPEDYVLELLRPALRRGGVLLAVDGKRVVGMMNTVDCLGGGLWLSMARTDPDYRRKGVASALLERAVREGKVRGHRQVRLWSNADNPAGNATARANGFREVGRFFGALHDPAKGRLLSHVAYDAAAVWELTRDSPLVAGGGGYIHLEWSFLPYTRGIAEEIVERGWVRTLGESVLACRSEEHFEALDWLEFTILAGNVTTALREGSRLAGFRGAGGAFTYLPQLPAHHRSARAAEYRVVPWATDAVLFEKGI